MNAASLALAGVVGLFLSGLPAALAPGARGRFAATTLMLLGALCVLGGTGLALLHPDDAALTFEWSLPLGRFAIAIDPLTALFLLPATIVPMLAIVYGHGYLEAHATRPAGSHPGAPSPGALARIRVFYGVLAGSLALLLLARDSILFLLAWEGMALASFFLITADDRDPAAREAGWIYLVATHVGTLALFAFFALLGATRGDTAIALVDASGAHAPGALFALGLVGFGLKAGLMPLHVWLPPAHAAAASHVSAVLSGVVTKMGVYGLIRTISILPDLSLTWGVALIVMGGISAIGALAFALGQADIKRMLAYSTIENIGVIAMGVGLALVGRAVGEPGLMVLGLGGALLHSLAHALFKSLMFFAAGGMIHATGTRNLDQMGGLAKKMPRTASLFALAAVAICALPPLAGFASELLIYLAAFRTLGGQAPAVSAIAAPMLALTGALAIACFVRAFGAAFLGEPRTEGAAHAHESSRVMLVPMALLALVVVLIGLLPQVVAPLIDQVVGVFGAPGAPSLGSLAPFGWVSGGGLALAVVAGGLYFALRARVRKTAFRAVPTWDCGYARPSARMQYTASSFSASLVKYFPWLVRPHEHKPAVSGPFPAATHFERRVPDLVLDSMVEPGLHRAATRIAWVRIMQHGRLQTYILYILIALVGLFIGLGL